MASDVDAVIAALRVVLKEAEWRTDLTWFKAETVNRWIKQLPRAKRGRWGDLMMKGDAADEVKRLDLIGHVCATITYLEVNRDTIQALASKGWWPFQKVARPVGQPVAPAAVERQPSQIEEPQQEKQEAPEVEEETDKPKWLN